jgi:hypothetical protein
MKIDNREGAGLSMRKWALMVEKDPFNASLYSIDANHRPTYWIPPKLWRERAASWRQTHHDNIASPFSPPAADSAEWPTALVGVVATVDGSWQMPRGREFVWARKFITFCVYQRSDATRPRFSPNFGFEGGVFIQFVLEHYDNLPNQTLFLQGSMKHHNGRWAVWTRCLLPNVTYAPLTSQRLSRPRPNGQLLDGEGAYDAIIEQCWRDMLTAFNRSTLMKPGRLPQVRYFGASLAVVSRGQLLKQPRSSYEMAHRMLAGGDGRCVREELRWDVLGTRRTSHSLLYDSPLGRGKHTSGAAYESLHAVLLGGYGLEDALLVDYCSFYRHSADCPGSPCPLVKPAPQYVSSEYKSALYTPALQQQTLEYHRRVHEARKATSRRIRLKRQAAAQSQGQHARGA